MTDKEALFLARVAASSSPLLSHAEKTEVTKILDRMIFNICPEGDCMDKSQCWEPCGDLGHDEDYVVVINER